MQVGGFYFDSNFDVTTVGFDCPPPVTVNHTNETGAVRVFGVSARINY